ncbi:MAG: PLP-dependent aminotransferase family protein [candidate division Zixibacteria bacterium]|nr:PLP-dependent aminotransferase family protein [candidate division Zixibacteria bacterium]
MSETMVEKKVKANPAEWILASHVADLEASIIREILKISSQPGVISFAGGLPAPEMFPLDELKSAAVKVIEENQSSALQYSFTMGVPALREALAQRETDQGTDTKPENILITSGSQQGISLASNAFIDPDDYIITESPTYVGAILSFDFNRAKYAQVEMDNDGMLTDQLEDQIKKYKPKFIYTVSTFQNPTGITMSMERRKALIDIALKYNVPILEDNPYKDVRFAGEDLPSLRSMGGDIVISLGTFSKICAPGLRVAWVNAHPDILRTFEKIKQGADMQSNTFTQLMINEFIRSGVIDGHIEKLKVNYGAKCQLMLDEMEKHFSSEFTWTKPEGGLFLWCELLESMSASALLPKAIDKKVAYVYGAPFFPDKTGDNTLRLNFSNASHENIIEGIKRLGEVFKENMP